MTLTEEINIHPKSSVYVFDVGQGDGMLVSVLEKFPVRNVIITGVVHTTDVYLEFLELLNEKKCLSVISTGANEVSGVEKSHSGSSSTYDEILRLAPLARDDERNGCLSIIVANEKKTIQDKDVTIELLWPLESLEGKTVKDAGENTEGGLNDTSVVSRITLDGTTFLFPGDAGVGVEQKILESNEEVQSDVLMLAHHGSKTASSEEWLKVVNLKYAVISAGQKNNYKFPAYITVRRVERLEIPIYRTDQDGTITFLVEGGKMSILAYLHGTGKGVRKFHKLITSRNLAAEYAVITFVLTVFFLFSLG